MNEDTNELLRRVEALEKWKEDRERQQITLPLDTVSIDILNNYFMRLTGAYITVAGAGGHTFVTYLGKQNLLGQFSPATFEVSGVSTFQYTADATANTGTLLNGVTIVDGQRFFIATSDTPPNPLVVGDTYFAINANNDSVFEFSTDGITPIDLTTTGTGQQFVTFF